mmetsp:Transcript_7175/g.31722  ORF Transcript_7175/g.31722 Transcript_7175/m.31722 type:complete len:81 (+) Transcript_7175:2045-2287(+)
MLLYMNSELRTPCLSRKSAAPEENERPKNPPLAKNSGLQCVGRNSATISATTSVKSFSTVVCIDVTSTAGTEVIVLHVVI